MIKTWNKTITVYNRYENTQTGEVSYYRHTIDSCFVKATNNKITVANTQIISNNVIIRIPQQNNFLTAYKWEQIPNDKMGAYLTLKAGDLIILGAVTDDINEYLAGHRATDIVNKYKTMGSITVSAVNINTDLRKPHYLVSGE